MSPTITTYSASPSNIGPLTTAFAAPSSCGLLSIQIDTGVTFIENYRFDWPSVGDCFPSGYPLDYHDYYIYSPGVCPSDWVAYTDPNYSLTTETTVKCCPPSWTHITTMGTYCTWNILAETTTTALIITGLIASDRAYGDNTAGPSTSTDFVMKPSGASIEAIEVRYKAGNLGSQVNTTPSSQPTYQNDNPSLSTGVKIGIGVGLPILVTIFLVAFACFWIRSRRRGLGISNDGDFRDFRDSPPEYREHIDELPGNEFSVRRNQRNTGEPEPDTSVRQMRPITELDQNGGVLYPRSANDRGRRPEFEGRAISAEPRLPVPGIQEPITTLPPRENGNSTIARRALPRYESPIEMEPLPAFSETFPTTAGSEGDDEVLEYRERRLKERRELLAEKERLALEEDELRQLRAKTKGESSNSRTR